ncbi:hypothetical protein [uncultured Tessaracoccus sp.]|uniref:hypothetical protein n=1 Tax=uncultured Tessaracoccus sp. TaxID=905023 RepID=UPI0026089648|nr:hypothetical protein [uncultured Tessaracoccus sp.]
MSELNEIWRELARRASESKFSGVAAESDDLLGSAELREGLLSPNAAGGPNAMGGGPGMMPPMMMGGMGGRGGGNGSGGGGGLGGSTGPAPAGGAPSNYAPRQAGTLTSAKEIKPENAGDAMPGGAAPGGGMPAGGPMAAGGDAMSEGGGGVEDEAAEQAEPEDTFVPHAPTGEGDEVNRDGFTVEQGRMSEVAELWSQIADAYGHASSRMPAPVSLGFAEKARVSTDGLASAAERWGHEAAQEFLTISHSMVSSVRAYEESEDAAVTAAGKQEG